MSYRKAVLIFGIALVFQFSLLNIFSINGVTPNLILCLMIFIVFKYDDGLRPALVAIPFALLSDLMGGQYIGVSALALFILALTVGYLGRGLNRDSIWPLLAVSAGGTGIYYFIYWLVLTILGNSSTIVGLLKFLALALPINLIVILMVYLGYTRIIKRRQRPTSYAIVNMRSGTNKRNNKINVRNSR